MGSGEDVRYIAGLRVTPRKTSEPFKPMAWPGLHEAFVETRGCDCDCDVCQPKEDDPTTSPVDPQ